MDIQGIWHFKEDFGYGIDEGEMTIHQQGHKLSGTMVYEERISGDQPFVVCVDFEGMIIDSQIRFRGIDYEVFDVEDDWVFNLEERHGIMISNDLIQGTSMDVDGIEGKFILTRKKTFMEYI
jgi:hypothetical protein